MKSTTGGAHKKHKSNKTSSIESMVLTEEDIDDIGDTLHNAIEDMWGHIDDQYKSVLLLVQQGLKELQVQASAIQANVV